MRFAASHPESMEPGAQPGTQSAAQPVPGADGAEERDTTPAAALRGRGDATR